DLLILNSRSPTVTSPLSLHDALPIWGQSPPAMAGGASVGEVEGQGLTRAQRRTGVGVPALQTAEVDVEALGDGIQRVALAHLVEGGLPVRAGVAAAQRQHLVDAQAAAGELVPALDVGNAHVLASGDGPQRVAILDAVVVAVA